MFDDVQNGEYNTGRKSLLLIKRLLKLQLPIIRSLPTVLVSQSVSFGWFIALFWCGALHGGDLFQFIAVSLHILKGKIEISLG